MHPELPAVVAFAAATVVATASPVDGLLVSLGLAAVGGVFAGVAFGRFLGGVADGGPASA